jgi:hypothetical protein
VHLPDHPVTTVCFKLDLKLACSAVGTMHSTHHELSRSHLARMLLAVWKALNRYCSWKIITSQCTKILRRLYTHETNKGHLGLHDMRQATTCNLKNLLFCTLRTAP